MGKSFHIPAFLLMVAILVLSGCRKDEFTKPATLQMKFVPNFDVGVNGIKCVKVIISPSSLKIHGNRPVAEAVDLIRVYEEDRWECDNFFSHVETFDIPQGDYSSIEFTLSFREDSICENEVEDFLAEYKLSGDVKFFDKAVKEFLEHGSPGLVLVGDFELGDSEYMIVFVGNDSSLKVTGRSNHVVLQEGRLNRGEFELNTKDWFNELTSEDIYTAETMEFSEEYNKYVILIKNGVNQNLYNKIHPKINFYADVLIQ